MFGQKKIPGKNNSRAKKNSQQIKMWKILAVGRLQVAKQFLGLQTQLKKHTKIVTEEEEEEEDTDYSVYWLPYNRKMGWE